MSWHFDPVRSKFFNRRFDGATLKEAAKDAGVSEATAKRWIEEAKAANQTRRDENLHFKIVTNQPIVDDPRRYRRDPPKKRYKERNSGPN